MEIPPPLFYSILLCSNPSFSAVAMSSPRSIPTADRISSLPDSVLCHMLSFLPTKHAVATSVLSKRWTLLWLSVLTLDVDEENFSDFFSFRHFVYSVIVSRDPTLPIQSFRIKCGKTNNFDPCDINRFVLTAVKRGLQIFDLHLFKFLRSYDQKKLAPTILRLLSCRTLVVLKLRKLVVYDVPNLVHLPLLKTLHLHSIYFLNNFVHFMNLVRGCPILENLYMNDVQLTRSHASNEEFKGFPNLIRANISNCLLNFQFAWVYNAKFMYVEVYQRSIYEYQIPTFHNLTYMELSFYCRNSQPWNWLIQVLQYCPKLQNLIIHKAYRRLQAIEDEDWKEPETVPECLSSQLRTCSLRGFKGNQCELQFAEYIMLNSKLLCTMAIVSFWIDKKSKNQMLERLSSYPKGCVTCKLLFD